MKLAIYIDAYLPISQTWYPAGDAYAVIECIEVDYRCLKLDWQSPNNRVNNSCFLYFPLEAYNDGKIKDGDLILIAAFGSGFTWGASLIQW